MKKRSNLAIMGRLIKEVKPLSGYMTMAILLGTLGNVTASFITVFGGFAILDVLGLPSPMSVKAVFITVLVFALLRGLLRYAEQWNNHNIAFRLLALFRHKVFAALRKLCPAKLETRKKGDLISLITSDIELLEVFYAHTISPFAIWFLFTIIMVVFIGHYSWILALVALCAYLTVGILVPLVFSKTGGDFGLRFRNGAGSLGTFVLDSLRGLDEINQYDYGVARTREMGDRTDALAKDQAKMKENEGRNVALTNLIILFFDLVMFFVSAVLYRNGSIEFAGVLIPTLALISSFGPSSSLAALGSTLSSTFAAGNRVLDLLDEVPEVEEISGREPTTEFTGAKAEHLNFSYQDESVLSDFSLEIPKNSLIGVVGKSGSGKSTFLKLLMRFWNVTDGSLTVSDKPIDEINTSDLRNLESYVTQDTELFHDSIASNLRIAKQDATQEELEAACRKASIHDFIMTLPQGYHTKVGELGDTLSAGERQRLGLARAFLHDADLMLLDEPTSNLDSLNEAVVLKSLNEQREGKTIVLVSHRKSTMRICDREYSVENGRMS